MNGQGKIVMLNAKEISNGKPQKEETDYKDEEESDSSEDDDNAEDESDSS